MNNNQFKSVNKRLEKLAVENTAFNNCRQNMSDVNFEIGKSSYTAKIFGFIVLFAIFFGVRLIARQYVGNPDMTFSVGDIIFWCFIVLIGILVVVSMIHEKNKPSFTNDDSLRKMLYLASNNIVERWTVSCRNWDMVSNQLRIMFEDRESA